MVFKKRGKNVQAVAYNGFVIERNQEVLKDFEFQNGFIV